MTFDYQESIGLGYTSMGSYQDWRGCSFYKKSQLPRSKPLKGKWVGLWGIGLESTLFSFVYINWTLQPFNPITHTSSLGGGKIQMPTCDNIKVFGRLQCFKQEKEEISQRKHWWTKQRECIYELFLKTREPDDEAWECHIICHMNSSGQKHQQRRGVLWFKLK